MSRKRDERQSCIFHNGWCNNSYVEEPHGLVLYGISVVGTSLSRNWTYHELSLVRFSCTERWL